MEETINITKKEYKKLKENNKFLDCLKGAGVDNWDGYSDAWELMETNN